jgi:hypothetical protein
MVSTGRDQAQPVQHAIDLMKFDAKPLSARRCAFSNNMKRFLLTIVDRTLAGQRFDAAT